eukprot:g31136.t1
MNHRMETRSPNPSQDLLMLIGGHQQGHATSGPFRPQLRGEPAEASQEAYEQLAKQQKQLLQVQQQQAQVQQMMDLNEQINQMRQMHMLHQQQVAQRNAEKTLINAAQQVEHLSRQLEATQAAMSHGGQAYSQPQEAEMPFPLRHLNQSAVQARGEGPVLLEAFVAKKLREHQKEGVRFMYDAIAKNRGCILADTMGLGKSLQALALLWAVLSNNLLRKAIIVCPSSLCGNWRAEVKKWKILSQIREFRDFASRRLLVISYDQLRRHVQLVDDVCDLLICDEGSQGTATSKTLGQMRCRRRILLSGTPLQNDLEELFHCGRFVRPDLFAPQSPGYMAPKAAAWAVQCAREPLATPEEKALGQQVTRELEQKTLQFLLRRTMEMVNFNLPPRVEIVLRLRLAPVQATTLHRGIGYTCGYFTSSDGPLYAKSLALLALLQHWHQHAPNDRVVVVSNFSRTLKRLQRLVTCKSVLLSGDTPPAKRMQAVEALNTPGTEGTDLLLLSSKAGGTGLNLIGANRLVLFDPDWNPANDAQAMARIWREGQTKPCYIYHGQDMDADASRLSWDELRRVFALEGYDDQGLPSPALMTSAFGPSSEPQDHAGALLDAAGLGKALLGLHLISPHGGLPTKAEDEVPLQGQEVVFPRRTVLGPTPMLQESLSPEASATASPQLQDGAPNTDDHGGIREAVAQQSPAAKALSGFGLDKQKGTLPVATPARARNLEVIQALWFLRCATQGLQVAENEGDEAGATSGDMKSTQAKRKRSAKPTKAGDGGSSDVKMQKDWYVGLPKVACHSHIGTARCRMGYLEYSVQLYSACRLRCTIEPDAGEYRFTTSLAPHLANGFSFFAFSSSCSVVEQFFGGFLGAMMSYTLLIDIGTQTGLAANERPTIKIVSVVGFVYCLTLLGMVVDLIREDCRMRFSSVPAHGHWLILGWGDKTLLLVDELLTSIASRPQRRCGCCRRRQIVILADMPEQQMADEVKVHCLADPLLQRIGTLFFPIVRYKQGNPTDISELLRVSAPMAQDILVASTSENGNLSDLKAISALLAVAAMPNDSQEVCQEQSLRAMNIILPQARGIVARKLVNRIMVLRALVPSAGFVFLSMTSLKSTAKLQLLDAPPLTWGVPFRDAQANSERFWI